MIADNYEDYDQAKSAYEKAGLKQPEIEGFTRLWRNTIKQSEYPLGYMYFRNVIKIHPELLRKFSFGSLPEHQRDTALEEHGEKLLLEFNHCLAAFTDFGGLYNHCLAIRQFHRNISIMPCHVQIFREALITTIEEVIGGDGLSREMKLVVNRIFFVICSMFMGQDVSTQEDKSQKIDTAHWRLLLHSVHLLKQFDWEAVGHDILKILINDSKDALSFFGFDNKDRYLQSNISK